MGPVPGLGQHTDAVLTEFGCTADEVEKLRAASIVGGPASTVPASSPGSAR